MYESPIEVYYKDMRTKIENNIFEAVCNVGVSVDKDELVKALQYDRGQYEKGYADGLCHRTDDWISVDERLPEKDGRYLVAMKNGDNYHISTRRFKRTEPPIWWKGHVFGYWSKRTCGVRFWMPLPSPPEKEKNND